MKLFSFYNQLRGFTTSKMVLSQNDDLVENSGIKYGEMYSFKEG